MRTPKEKQEEGADVEYVTWQDVERYGFVESAMSVEDAIEASEHRAEG